MTTPSPFDPPTPPPDVQTRQITERDRLVRMAILAADEYVMRLPWDATGAERTRTAVTAAIGYLICHGLIEVKDDWPEWMTTNIPAHLAPGRTPE